MFIALRAHLGTVQVWLSEFEEGSIQIGACIKNSTRRIKGLKKFYFMGVEAEQAANSCTVPSGGSAWRRGGRYSNTKICLNFGACPVWQEWDLPLSVAGAGREGGMTGLHQARRLRSSQLPCCGLQRRTVPAPS